MTVTLLSSATGQWVEMSNMPAIYRKRIFYKMLAEEDQCRDGVHAHACVCVFTLTLLPDRVLAMVEWQKRMINFLHGVCYFSQK